MSDDKVPQRNDSSVFVEIHAIGEPLDRITLMELGRVPIVGEEIFTPPDHCLKVVRVIHLGETTIETFPRWAHQRDYPRVGCVAAFVECTDDAFDPSVLPENHL